MKKISIYSIFLGLLMLCCTKDDFVITGDCDPELTYDNGMAELIDRTCAYAVGCHGAGSDEGDFTTYSSMESDIEEFPGEVNSGSMPLPGTTPQLTPEEIELINCWVSNGYPEN